MNEPEFVWYKCSQCGWTVICPRCGNNICNGCAGPKDLSSDTLGIVGNCCLVCHLAYQYANAMRWEPGPYCKIIDTINIKDIRNNWIENEKQVK